MRLGNTLVLELADLIADIIVSLIAVFISWLLEPCHTRRWPVWPGRLWEEWLICVVMVSRGLMV